jgi:formylglycine-generating enzyme required for sulfatase activity
MVGNLDEWVADWVPLSTICPFWGGFSNDYMCLSGASTTQGPGALLRGGRFFDGAYSGPLSVSGIYQPSDSNNSFGFRCAR